MFGWQTSTGMDRVTEAGQNWGLDGPMGLESLEDKIGEYIRWWGLDLVSKGLSSQPCFLPIEIVPRWFVGLDFFDCFEAEVKFTLENFAAEFHLTLLGTGTNLKNLKKESLISFSFWHNLSKCRQISYFKQAMIIMARSNLNMVLDWVQNIWEGY